MITYCKAGMLNFLSLPAHDTVTKNKTIFFRHGGSIYGYS